MRPLGYPSIFRIHKVHEYILLFIKSGELIPDVLKTPAR